MDADNLSWEVVAKDSRVDRRLLEEILERPGNFIPVLGQLYRATDSMSHTKSYNVVWGAYQVVTISYLSYYFFSLSS